MRSANMDEISSAATLGGELFARVESLRDVKRRVECDAAAVPRADSLGWRGPAGWACDLSLRLLSHEIEAALEQLRSATTLTETAAAQAGGYA